MKNLTDKWSKSPRHEIVSKYAREYTGSYYSDYNDKLRDIYNNYFNPYTKPKHDLKITEIINYFNSLNLNNKITCYNAGAYILVSFKIRSTSFPIFKIDYESNKIIYYELDILSNNLLQGSKEIEFKNVESMFSSFKEPLTNLLYDIDKFLINMANQQKIFNNNILTNITLNNI